MHKPQTTEFCTVAPNVCGSSVRKLLHVTLLMPRILRWLLDFWKISTPLLYTNFEKELKNIYRKHLNIHVTPLLIKTEA